MMSECEAITGAIVSSTVTVKLPVDVLLCESVAEQLTVVVPNANVLAEAGEHATKTEPSTMSNDEAVNVTTAPDELVASAAIFAGKFRVGGVVSSTVTVKLPLAVLLCASVAEQLTVVAPNANVPAEAGEHATKTEPSTRSEDEAVNVTTAPEELVASAVMFAGKFRVGGVVSCTMTVKLPLDVLPCASVAEQLTVVVPSANVLAEAGEQTTGTETSTMSEDEAVNVATAPEELVASEVMFAGRLNTGGVVSCTVTVKLPLAALPRVSDAEQLTVVTPTEKVLFDGGLQVTGLEPLTMSVADAE